MFGEADAVGDPFVYASRKGCQVILPIGAVLVAHDSQSVASASFTDAHRFQRRGKRPIGCSAAFVFATHGVEQENQERNDKVGDQAELYFRRSADLPPQRLRNTRSRAGSRSATPRIRGPVGCYRGTGGGRRRSGGFHVLEFMI